MAEQSTWIPGGQEVGQRETEERREILDFDKYGALYGRFLLASQAKTAEEIANIIDPTNKVRFNDLTTDTLKDRNYNPICENVSLAERKKQWEGREFSDAYKQWRTEFTSFMTEIKDPQREKALRTIMPNLKQATAFKEDDADTLFNDFCKGASDIDNFIKRVTANLGLDNKRDSKNLKELLPHLEWIASGLFGKETASQVVTRLIELESAMHNNLFTVVNSFNEERINTPTDDEKRVLGLLHKSFSPVPEAERIPTRVTTVAAVAPSVSDIPKPAPVTQEPEKKEPDEVEDKLRPPPVAPRANGPTSAAEALRKEIEAAAARIEQHRQEQSRNTAAQELEREIASLRDLFAAPVPRGETTVPLSPPPNVPKSAEGSIGEKTRNNPEEIGEITDFNDELLRWQREDYEIRICKYDDHWTIFFDVNSRYVDQLVLPSENFDLATALKKFEDKGLKPDATEKIYQSLAESFLNGLEKREQIFLDLLEKFSAISVKAHNGETILISRDWLSDNELFFESVDGSMYNNYEHAIRKLDPETIRSLNVSIGKAVLEAWIKGEGAGKNVASSAGSQPEETAEPTAERELPAQETDPVRIFIRRYKDKLGDPNQYGGIRYSAVRRASLGKGSGNIDSADKMLFDSYEDFRGYLRTLTPSEMKMMKKIKDIHGRLSLNIGFIPGEAEKDLYDSVRSDPELKKAMFRRGLLKKSLLDEIRFGEYELPEE